MSAKIFVHGLQSSSRGTKATFFRAKYPDMIIPNFPGDFQARLSRLKAVLRDETDICLVGSSYGGLLVSVFAMENEPKVKRLILLAPAINLDEFSSFRKRKTSLPTWIYHGKHDDVIPLREVETIAGQVFQNLSFQALDDDHSLHKTFREIPWDTLLS